MGEVGETPIYPSMVVEPIIAEEIGILEAEGFKIGCGIVFGSINTGNPKTGQQERSDLDILFLTADENFPNFFGGKTIVDNQPGMRFCVTRRFPNDFCLSRLDYYVMSPARATHLLGIFSHYCQELRIPLTEVVTCYNGDGKEFSTDPHEMIRGLSWLYLALKEGTVFRGSVPEVLIPKITEAGEAYGDFNNWVARQKNLQG